MGKKDKDGASDEDGCKVLHQDIWLDIDADKQTFEGYTELYVSWPSRETSLGLHCLGLSITDVKV